MITCTFIFNFRVKSQFLVNQVPVHGVITVLRVEHVIIIFKTNKNTKGELYSLRNGYLSGSPLNPIEPLKVSESRKCYESWTIM